MTRYQRFIERRRRYLRRAYRQREGGWSYVKAFGSGGFPYWKRVARKWALVHGPTQYVGLKKTPDDRPGPNPPFSIPFLQYQVFDGRPHVPPHVKFIGFYATFFHANPQKHQKSALIEYHLHRIKARKHRVGRMNGFQRACWGAAYQAIAGGFFPDWDPLHGTPTEAQVLAGAPPYSGPFRKTPGRP